MKIELENRNIKCDSINCGNLAISRLNIGSYKGLIFLCKDCLKQLQTILKRNIRKDEQS